MMAVRLVFLIPIWGITLCSITSCNNDKAELNNPSTKEKDLNQSTNLSFVSDTIFLTDEFGDFESPLIREALGNLLICDVYVDTVEKLVLPCDARFFRAFPLKKNGTYNDGFIVDVKPGVIPGSPTRRLFTIIRQGDKWRVTNDLKGTLLELRSTENGYWDLIVRYTQIKTETKVAILHRWDEKERAFLPKKVSEINDRFINPEYLDSLNKVYITNFVWGF